MSPLARTRFLTTSDPLGPKPTSPKRRHLTRQPSWAFSCTSAWSWKSHPPP